MLYITRTKALEIITPLPYTITETPADYGLPYEEVSVTTSDGYTLAGWYIPSQNGAVIITQHGWRGGRMNMLYDAEMLYRHGYGVLISSFRSGDANGGELITFGKKEIVDMDTRHQYLLTRTDIDLNKIGILGESMGGMISIMHTAQNPNIRALALHCSFSSVDAMAAKGVKLVIGLPPFPFANLIVWWGEQIAGFKSPEIDAARWIRQISPRPVFIMMGSQDDHIPIESGQWLHDAANEPKEYCFVPEAGHHGIPEVEPEEYERRVTEFFDENLLGE